MTPLPVAHIYPYLHVSSLKILQVTLSIISVVVVKHEFEIVDRVILPTIYI